MTTWTEVPASGAHRAWTAWDAEQADRGALVVLEHDPEWGKPWVASVLGPTVRDGISATPDGALRMAGCDLTPPDTFPRTLRRDADGLEQDERPDAPWARALDPQPGETVTDDRGRRWMRPMQYHQCWTSRGAGDVHDAERGGTVWATVVRRAVATLPDALRGLDRLNAASDVLDGRLDDLPDGVEVTEAWRERCAIAAQAGSVAEPDERPVALPLLGGGLLLTSDVVEVGDEAHTYGDAAGVCTHVRTSTGLARLVPLPRSAVVEALGWRAVEVSRD